MQPEVKGLTDKDVNEMEERRIAAMQDANIDERDVLGKAQDNLGSWSAYFQDNITRYKSDVKFLCQEQWDNFEKGEFKRLFKPAMTFNKLYDAVRKILGEERKNKPDLLVRSLTGRATEEQIDLRADLVRTISYQSQNELVFQEVFKQQLMGGWGALEVAIEYESPHSFNKVIRFRVIQDPTRVSFDPAATKPHKGDGNFCSRAHYFSREQFAAAFPYIENPVSYTDKRAVQDLPWLTREGIVVCDYAQKDWYSFKALLLSNGEVVTQDEWEELKKEFEIKKQLAASTEIVRKLILEGIPRVIGERQSEDYNITIYRLTQDQIIDFNPWPSKQLPLIYADGDSVFIEGKQYTQSFIHKARDAQKFENYVGSEIAAEVKNRRREQWLVTKENIAGFEGMWNNPESQQGALIAKPDPKTGNMPQKMPAWEISPGLLEQFQRANMDIKEILGFHDEMSGQETNAQSGIAVANRQMASSMSAYVFRDNLNQAIEQAGRLVLDLLPHVYGDDDRHMVVSKPDGTTKSVILNQKMPDGKVLNELLPGDYDIEIDTGPSFAVQKQQALELFLGLVQTNPQLFPLVADLIAKNLDVQYMPQIVERFKTLVPPQILAKEEGLPPPPPQPDPEQQMMQQQAQLQQVEMQIKMQEVQQKQAQLQLDIQQHEIEKQRLLMEAAKIQADTQTNISDHLLEVHKTKLDFAAKIAGIHAKNRQ